jgi:hypothetical protein
MIFLFPSPWNCLWDRLVKKQKTDFGSGGDMVVNVDASKVLLPTVTKMQRLKWLVAFRYNKKQG